jgi:hypothetical protein
MNGWSRELFALEASIESGEVRMFAFYNVRRFAVLLLLAVFAGCASFANLGSNGRYEDESSSDPAKKYTVEMGNMMSRPTIYEGKFEDNMTVQMALERSGAIRRYRNMDIAIERTVEETGMPLRMVVQYWPAKRSVSPEQDYALLPGDRIIVEPASGLRDALGGKR